MGELDKIRAMYYEDFEVGLSESEKVRQLKELKESIIELSENSKHVGDMEDIRREYREMLDEPYQPYIDDDSSKGTMSHGMQLPKDDRGIRR